MPRRWIWPAVGLLTLAALFAVAVVVSRQHAAPGAVEADPLPAPVPAAVLLTAQATEVPAAHPEHPDVRALLALLNNTHAGVLDAGSAAAVQDALKKLRDADRARILTSPRVMTMSGSPASISIDELGVGSAGEPLRRSVELELLPIARADGSVSLSAEFARSDVRGQIELFIDDLGVPVGTARAGADVVLPAGSHAYLARRVRGGSLLIVIVEPAVRELDPP